MLLILEKWMLKCYYFVGISAECQAGRSQIKNKQLAMQQLRAKIYDIEVQKRLNEIQSSRKIQVNKI